jgi:hypothetical protein
VTYVTSAQWLSLALSMWSAMVPAPTSPDQQESMMTKLVLALTLAFATLAAVPASAGPYCQEDLGYGRTSSFGCGG